MSQMPRWARKQMLEHQLEDVIHNDYADQADVQAAKDAIEQKLDQQDRDFQRQQAQRTQDYLKSLQS